MYILQVQNKIDPQMQTVLVGKQRQAQWKEPENFTSQSFQIKFATLIQMRIAKSLYLLKESPRVFSTIEMLSSTQVVFIYKISGKFNKACTNVL